MSTVPNRPEVCRPTSVPAREKPPGQIIRLEGGQAAEGVIVSASLHGYIIHYDPRTKRSSPCTSPESECKGHAEKLPAKNRWYVFFLHMKLGLCWIELTDGAARQLKEALQDREEMRGLRVRISRTRSDRGRLNVEVIEWADRRKDLPPDKEPIELLHFLWNARRT